MEVFEMEKEFNDLMKKGQELIERMKKEQSKKVRWKPEDGDVYYYINTSGDIDNFKWFGVSGSSVDRKLYKINNCFQTREEAQKELGRRIAEQELLEMCDWEGGDQYNLLYHFKTNTFNSVYSLNFIQTPYRFASKKSCQNAIKQLGTEKLKLIFRID